MSRKGIRNKKGNIEYPRLCKDCGHVSNNPSTWHYHQRKHETVPDDKFCDFGCGQRAKYKNTNNRYTCAEKWADCPEYLKNHSERVKEDWRGASKRRDNARKTLLKYVAGNPDVIEKQKQTLREKFGILSPEEAGNYRHYARYIRKRSQQWAKEQGYELGRSTYHVDHKFSILDSWHANLSEELVNHPVNLHVISASENSAKGPRSLFTLNELLRFIKEDAMDKHPLGIGIDVELGKPFVSSTDQHLRNRVIVQSVKLLSQHGEVLYSCYELVDPNPTKEEIFKITLANPQPLVAVKVNTESVFRRRLEDN